MPRRLHSCRQAEVIIVGGGIAGLSAAIYLGRAKRDTLVIDSGKSMARWEPKVANYLGFPHGISGEELLRRARHQARNCRVKFVRDVIVAAQSSRRRFFLRGHKTTYACRRLLLATGGFHIPPDIPGVKPCLGHSMFFCKDCDGCRVQDRSIAVYGWTNDTVEYALAMLSYSKRISIVTDGRKPRWSRLHEKWLRASRINLVRKIIRDVRHRRGRIQALVLQGESDLPVEGLFTTRGDIYFSKLAQGLDAKVNRAGEIVVDVDMSTSVKGVYAAGCVTPANCQMIIAAGQGASAAQAINRSLFEESLKTLSEKLRRKGKENQRPRKER